MAGAWQGRPRLDLRVLVRRVPSGGSGGAQGFVRIVHAALDCTTLRLPENRITFGECDATGEVFGAVSEPRHHGRPLGVRDGQGVKSNKAEVEVVAPTVVLVRAELMALGTRWRT